MKTIISVGMKPHIWINQYDVKKHVHSRSCTWGDCNETYVDGVGWRKQDNNGGDV